MSFLVISLEPKCSGRIVNILIVELYENHLAL